MANARSAATALGTSALAGLLLCGPVASVALAQAGDAEARFEVGLGHLREGRIDLALEELGKAIKANDKNPYFQKAMGHALAAKGRYGEAIAHYRKALEINPYFVDVRNDLGSALVLSGKREEGKKEFLLAFGDPTNPTPEIAAHNLGLAYLEEKAYPQAMDWLNSAIHRNKAYAECYILSAEALRAVGRGEEALARLEAGHKEAPSSIPLRVALGEALFASGRFGEARAHLDEAVKADPSGPLGRRAAAILKNLPR